MPSDDEKISKKSGEVSRKSDPPSSSKPWTVGGGGFSFIVSFRFAICDLKLQDHRLDHGENPDQLLDIQEKDIYALPMQLTERIKSSAVIEVSQEIEDMVTLRIDPSDPRKEHLWKIEPQSKQAERSIWGKCTCFLAVYTIAKD